LGKEISKTRCFIVKLQFLHHEQSFQPHKTHKDGSVLPSAHGRRCVVGTDFSHLLCTCFCHPVSLPFKVGCSSGLRLLVSKWTRWQQCRLVRA
jgi:hypothetical protein